METVFFCVLPALLYSVRPVSWFGLKLLPLHFSPVCAAVPCAAVAVWPRRVVDTAFKVSGTGPVPDQTVHNSAAPGKVKATLQEQKYECFPSPTSLL